MRKTLALLAIVLFTAGVTLAAKNYQTGKLVDADSQLYTKSSSTIHHENTLAVQIGDLIYFGQCDQKKNSDHCRPADWIIGDPVQVRFEKDFMYLEKAKGGEVKTRIVKRERAQTAR